jgi:hypothetical protein
MQSSHILRQWEWHARTDFGSRRGEVIGKRKWFRYYYCQNQGACYRHNLARLEDGPRARWAQKIFVMGFRTGSCAGSLRPEWPCI